MSIFKTKKGTELPLLKLKGNDYLQVAHRLVWFREEHPDWRIETKLIIREADESIAVAVIKNEKGKVMATAHKRENTKGFADHLEKAETGAVGRALAMVGYGTQFCADELDEGDRLADAPVPPASVSQAIDKLKSVIKPTEGGTYVITFGKHKGKSLSDMDMFELNNYVRYIFKEAEMSGKPIQGQVLDFIERAEAFLKQKEKRPNEPS